MSKTILCSRLILNHLLSFNSLVWKIKCSLNLWTNIWFYVSKFGKSIIWNIEFKFFKSDLLRFNKSVKSNSWTSIFILFWVFKNYCFKPRKFKLLFFPLKKWRYFLTVSSKKKVMKITHETKRKSEKWVGEWSERERERNYLYRKNRKKIVIQQ